MWWAYLWRISTFFGSMAAIISSAMRELKGQIHFRKYNKKNSNYHELSWQHKTYQLHIKLNGIIYTDPCHCKFTRC
jgi:hypothetical protein